MSEFILVVTEFYTPDTDAAAHHAVVSKQADNRQSSASYLMLLATLDPPSFRGLAAHSHLLFQSPLPTSKHFETPDCVSGSYVLCALV